MCAQPNPEELEVCQFCEARLKPLIAPSPDDQESIEPEAAQDTPQVDSDLPDWLQDIREEGDDIEGEQPLEGEEEDDLDTDPLRWLDRIQDDEEAPSLLHEDSAAAEEDEESVEEEPEWLQRIRSLQDSEEIDQEPSAEDIKPVFEPEEQVPDIPPSEEEVDLPQETIEEEIFEGELEIPSDVDADLASESDVLEVLPELKGVEQTAPGEEESLDEDQPDWLSQFTQDDVEAPGPPQPESVDAVPMEEEAEDLPDWLAQIEEIDKQIIEEEPLEEEQPEWLSQYGADQDEPISTLSVPEAEAPPDEDEDSEWMVEFEDVEEEAPGDEEVLEEEQPDWLSELAEEEGEIPSPEPFIAGTEYPSEAETAEEAVPDWLFELEDSAPEILAEEVEIESVAEQPPEEESLPEWVLEEPEEDIEEQVSGAEPEEAEIAQADLPTWLATMVPAEGTKDEIDEKGKVETAGPLVGLSETLAAEPEIARLKRPPAYSVKLQITENQQKHAKLWEQLLASEGEPKEIPKPPVLSTQSLLRWLIALALLIVIAGVVVIDSRLVPYLDPAAIPSEVLDTSRLINALPAQAPVMIAFDYEPGLSGEMDASAAAVVDHLMLKGAYLTLISTSPTGPVVAERFVNQIQAEHGYTSSEQYTNLGYVPGGISGLQGFAQIPQRVAPLSFDGLDAWETQPLQSVVTLADFAMALVITDNPETARAWVEQVQPMFGNTPLVMVVSAQAEPLVRPYRDGNTRQVDGLISSLTGGAAYEALINRSNLVRGYWDAFSAGLLIAVGSILLGGAFNLGSALLTRMREDKEITREAK
jgi:hypothetical protein